MGRIVLAALAGFALGSGACMVADHDLSVAKSSISSSCFDTGDGVVCASDSESFVEVDPSSVISKKDKKPKKDKGTSSTSDSSASDASASSASDSAASDSSSEPSDGGGSACPAEPTGSELTQGTAEAIEFDGATLIDQLLLAVDTAWLGAGTHSLAIEITGLNGGFEYHGNQVIAVDDTVVFDTDMDTAFVVADWSADETPRQVNEVYTVCVQVLVCDIPTGPIKCQDFGPF